MDDSANSQSPSLLVILWKMSTCRNRTLSLKDPLSTVTATDGNCYHALYAQPQSLPPLCRCANEPHLSLSYLSVSLPLACLSMSPSFCHPQLPLKPRGWFEWLACWMKAQNHSHSHTHAVLQTGLFTGESQHFHTVSRFSRMCLDGSGWAAIHTHTHTLSGTKMKACSTVYVEQTCMWYGVCWSLCSRTQKKANLHVFDKMC